MKISLIDNYDSFTHLLFRLTEDAVGVSPVIMKNDEINLDVIEESDLVILSPGPALPTDSGQLMELIDRFHQTVPMLGVCLGHQAIAEYFGAKLINLATVAHGIKSRIRIIEKRGVFANLPEIIEVGRYHSWVVDEKSLPSCLQVTAVDDELGYIMGLRHRELPLEGIQFHPESYMTQSGTSMFKELSIALKKHKELKIPDLKAY